VGGGGGLRVAGEFGQDEGLKKVGRSGGGRVSGSDVLVLVVGLVVVLIRIVVAVVVAFEVVIGLVVAPRGAGRQMEIWRGGGGIGGEVRGENAFAVGAERGGHSGLRTHDVQVAVMGDAFFQQTRQGGAARRVGQRRVVVPSTRIIFYRRPPRFQVAHNVSMVGLCVSG